MTRMANEYERADHYRDLAKHDDIPLRLEPAPIQHSLEIAILAQAVPLLQAAELIERYVRAECAAAKLDAVVTTIDRCCEAIEKHGERSDA